MVLVVDSESEGQGAQLARSYVGGVGGKFNCICGNTLEVEKVSAHTQERIQDTTSGKPPKKGLAGPSVDLVEETFLVVAMTASSARTTCSTPT